MVSKPWVILGQRQSQRLGPDGRVQNIFVITFQSFPSGTVATEDVPLEQYTVENVARVLDDRHAVIEAVHEL